MAIYSMTRYPRDIELRDGTHLTIRPMVPLDVDGLLEFFHQVPEEDRFFLKEDVVSPNVIQAWGENLDYDRALPLMAIHGDRIVGDAVLIRHRGGFRRHMAEIRVVIAPEMRGKGLGVVLMRELIEIAWDAELEQVEFEMVKDVQDEAIRAAEFLGAFKVGTVTNAVRDCRGDLHDLVFLRLPLGNWWKLSQF